MIAWRLWYRVQYFHKTKIIEKMFSKEMTDEQNSVPKAHPVPPGKILEREGDDFIADNSSGKLSVKKCPADQGRVATINDHKRDT